MKLELKYLAGYLPYGLKCNVMGMATEETEYDDNPIAIVYTMVGLFTDSNGSEYAECAYNIFRDNVYINTDLFPILRPLSDLTKEIEVNGEKFVPIVELLKIKYKSFYDEKINSKYSEIDLKNCNNYAESFFKHHSLFQVKIWYNSLKEEPYWAIEKLLEWHFDIYGLIEKGLAIDINEL